MGLSAPFAAGAPPRLSRELLRRYDLAVPRYTSYPPANRFDESFGEPDHRRLLARAAGSGGPLSLYVHLPFCAARCLFCGCNVTIARDRARAAGYLTALEGEAAAVGELLGRDRPIVEAHWGGGTPTFLDASQIAELALALRRRLPFAPAAELSVEVDPRHCSGEQLDALAAAGATRLSLGVQDLDPRVQAAVRRVQPLARVQEVVEGARARGIRGLGVDLIYGLPYQTTGSFVRTLESIVRLAPGRIAVFGFAYLPEKLRHQRALPAEALPGPEERWELLAAAIAVLGAAGYAHVGLDHFARPEDPLARAAAAGTLGRNFQGYTPQDGLDLVGLGASAISQLGGGYAQNRHAAGDYQQAVARGGLATARGVVLGAEDELRRHVIHRLLCAGRIDKADVEARHACGFDRLFGVELARLGPFADDGLVELTDDALVLTPTGRLLARTVAAVFDPAAASAGSTAAHARAV